VRDELARRTPGGHIPVVPAAPASPAGASV